MKKITLNATLIMLIVLGCFSLDAQVLWYGDPNEDVRTVFRRLDPDGNRNPTGNRCVDDPTNPPKVSTPTDSLYGKFWRIDKPVSRKRAEFARTNGFIPQQGKDYYIGWRWRINASPNIDRDVTVFQWKTDQGGDLSTNKQNYPFNLEYDGRELKLNAYGPAEPNWNRPGSITKRRTTLWTGEVEENEWVTFVFRVRVNRDFNSASGRYEGFIEFWFNGVKQTLMNSRDRDYQVALSGNKKRAYHRTNDGAEVYMKWGSYNENACDINIITDFDDMRVAKNYNAAKPDPAGSFETNTPEEGNDYSGTFTFQNVATGNYLDSDGATITTSTTDSGSDKRWRLVETGDGFYNIDNFFEGRGILQTAENKVVNGTNIEPVSTLQDKQWSIESLGDNRYRFKNRFTGRGYLAAKTTDGLVEWTPWDGGRSQWILRRISTNLKSSISVNEETENGDELSLYPNPVNKELNFGNIESPEAEIRVFDLSGNHVLSTKVKGVMPESRLDVSSLSDGIYIIKMESEGGTLTKKFVKE